MICSGTVGDAEGVSLKDHFHMMSRLMIRSLTPGGEQILLVVEIWIRHDFLDWRLNRNKKKTVRMRSGEGYQMGPVSADLK